jgi:hypothetical protein
MTRKCKSRLLKAMQNDEVYIYETTEEDCRYWFNVINREIFDNQLTFPDEVDIRWRSGTHAYHWITWNKDSTVKSTKLCMSKKYKSKRFFIQVLAHEMIHHWQALTGAPIGHGPSFLQWEERFAKKGMVLYKGTKTDEEAIL